VTELPDDAVRWLAERDVADSAVAVVPSGRALLVTAGDRVLRWYGTGTPGPEEPDAIDREVAALSVTAASTVPAPELVAWTDDPPAILMTRLPGMHRLDASGAAAVLDILHAVHATPPGLSARWTYRGYHDGLDLRPPLWWHDTRLWDRAADASASRRVGIDDVVFIHRDFHPGNLLWEGGSVTGVVDWGDACVGPAAFDLAHYRVNIATLVGPEAADTAFPGDPTWDVEAALGYLDYDVLDKWAGPWPEVPPAAARDRLEAFIARALAALG